MAEEKPLPPKIEVARYLLAQGSLFVHLDPRMEGVVVPKWYRSEPQLVLQIGFDMPVPIPDLQVDPEGIYGTLSFNRSPFTCNVQWDAVFALAGDDGRGMVWPDSMPEEISQAMEREAAGSRPRSSRSGPRYGCFRPLGKRIGGPRLRQRQGSGRVISRL